MSRRGWDEFKGAERTRERWFWALVGIFLANLFVWALFESYARGG